VSSTCRPPELSGGTIVRRIGAAVLRDTAVPNRCSVAGETISTNGTVVARMRPATGSHAVDRLIGALHETAHGISSVEFDSETCAAATSVLGLGTSTAGEHLAVLRDPTRGLIPDGSVDAASLTTLVALRRRFLPAPELDDVVARLDQVVRSRVLVT
jgi:hypothetical protein